MLGAPSMTVMPRSWMVSTVLTGSNRCTRTMRAPDASVVHNMTFRPKMWNIGSTPKVTSAGVMCSAAIDCSMFDMRLPWLSTAAFGEPAVPLVNM